MTILGMKTSHRSGVELYVVRDGEVHHHVFPETESDALLVAVDSLVRPEELSGIIVLESPGSFTAIRSAVVVANAIAVARGIPVVGAVSMEDGLQKLSVGANAFPLAPHYDREPNITVKKST